MTTPRGCLLPLHTRLRHGYINLLGGASRRRAWACANTHMAHLGAASGSHLIETACSACLDESLIYRRSQWACGLMSWNDCGRRLGRGPLGDPHWKYLHQGLGQLCLIRSFLPLVCYIHFVHYLCMVFLFLDATDTAVLEYCQLSPCILSFVQGLLST